MNLATDSVYFSRLARQSQRAAKGPPDKGPDGIHASASRSHEGLAIGDNCDVRPPKPLAPFDVDASEQWDNEGGGGAETALRAR